MTPAGRRARTAILISGQGSNMRTLVQAAAAPDYGAEIVGVLANDPAAPGLAFARDRAIATAVLPHRDFPSRRDFDAAIDGRLRAWGADLVCLAGFMRLLGPEIVGAWEGRILNIHPSLLPSFKGLHTHRRALAAGVRVSGCTVHFVTPDLDGGPIVGQGVVPVLPGDDEDRLSARVLAVEHLLYPACLDLVARGDARLDGDRVRHSAKGAARSVIFAGP